MLVRFLRLCYLLALIKLQAANGGSNKMLSATIEYYDKKSSAYAERTWKIDMSEQQSKFISMLNKSDYILDLGCGAGRDLKFFKEAGYRIIGIDGSKELSRIARVYSGSEVLDMTYDQLDFDEEFDAVWSCASLLHIDDNEFQDTLVRIAKSIKSNGIFHFSLKEGNKEYVDDKGRYFNLHSLSSLIQKILSSGLFSIHFIDRNVGEGNQSWLNVYLVKRQSVYSFSSKPDIVTRKDVDVAVENGDVADLGASLMHLIEKHGFCASEIEFARVVKKMKSGGFSNIGIEIDGSFKLIRDGVADQIEQDRPGEIVNVTEKSTLNDLISKKYFEEKKEFEDSFEANEPKSILLEELGDLSEVIHTIASK